MAKQYRMKQFMVIELECEWFPMECDFPIKWMVIEANFDWYPFETYEQCVQYIEDRCIAQQMLVNAIIGK